MGASSESRCQRTRGLADAAVSICTGWVVVVATISILGAMVDRSRKGVLPAGQKGASGVWRRRR